MTNKSPLRNLAKILFIIFFIAAQSPAFSKSSFIGPPQKITHKKIFDKQYEKYLLLYPSKDEDTGVTLYDTQGNSIFSWSQSAKRAKLLPNCNMLLIDHSGSHGIKEISPENDILWSYDPGGFSHHDFEITEDGDYAFFYSTTMPKSFELTNGCEHREVIADNLIIANRDGKHLFEWHFPDHYPSVINNDLCDNERRQHIRDSKFINMLDSIHPNSIYILKKNKWYDKGFEEFKPGNLLITMHHLNRAIIINRDTKKVVWIYKPSGDESLEGPHEAEMIQKGFPGEGNIILFDNGITRQYSRVIEINPITKKTVWSYQKQGEFFNRVAGSQQRLKNGDTFISDDNTGRVFIVDKQGNLKWQFTDDTGHQIRRAYLLPKKDFQHCLNKEWKK